MNAPLFLGLIAAALGHGPSDAVKKDLDAFQGRWKVQWLEQEGKKVEIRERVCIFRGNQCKWFSGTPGEQGEEASFEIDPTCTPKIIDYLSSAPGIKGVKKEGIYKIDGDTMVWCMDDGEGVKNRPLEFRTTRGSHRVVLWFTRSKLNEKKD